MVESDKSELDYAKEATNLPAKSPQREGFRGNWDKKFFDERSRQRNCLFWFALIITSLSFLLLAGVVAVQAYTRSLGNPNFQVMSDTSLEIFAVAVFGQAFGVVYIIAKAVWSNDEFGLMGKK